MIAVSLPELRVTNDELRLNDWHLHHSSLITRHFEILQVVE